MDLLNNFKEMVVLVTGGTSGVGLATIELFSKAGAKVYGTYLWGDNLDDLQEKILAYESKPTFIKADVSSDEDAESLIKQIKLEVNSIDIFISNIAFASHFQEGYQERDLLNSIKYSALPLIKYLKSIKKHFMKFPRYGNIPKL